MKIKRFVAADMRSAMNLVRREHGPEAVILSNRRVENGVEIVAAAHYDETAVQRALEAAKPAESKPKARTAAEAVIAALTGRRKAQEEKPATPTITTSAVAAIARAAVGSSGRDVESTAAVPVPPPLPEAALPDFLRNETQATSTGRSPNRARFVIDPPMEEDFRDYSSHTAMETVSAPSLLNERDVVAASPAAAATPAPGAAQKPLSVIPGGIVEESPQLVELRQEMAGMRQLIEREMARFTDERLRGNPVRAQAMDLMDEYGLDAGLARDIAAQIPAETELSRSRGLMLGLLSRKLPIAPEDPIRNGGIIALVGPTGAGKTTTIAKLASRFAAEHAPRDVALVTTDTRRIGAREQLYGFGRQLGIAVHEAENGSDLGLLLERLSDYKLVLVDTAGMGQRDRGLAAQLQWLRAAGQIRTLLTLPANLGFQDMDEVVRRFAPASPEGLVLTKLDETGRFGAALSVAVDHQLPISWVADGQDVPADLQRASAANLVLRLEDLRRAADQPSSQEPEHAIA